MAVRVDDGPHRAARGIIGGWQRSLPSCRAPRRKANDAPRTGPPVPTRPGLVARLLSSRPLHPGVAQDDGREEGRAARQRKLKLVNTPHFVTPEQEKLTFDDLAELLRTDYRLNGRRSLGHVERHIRRLGEAFACDRALSITPDRIAAYTAARLGRGVAPATVNRELAALRRMFSLAVKTGQILARPPITLLTEDNAREGFAEPAEFEAVAAHLPPAYADAARFAYLTGWRKTEVRTLEWRDITLDRN